MAVAGPDPGSVFVDYRPASRRWWLVVGAAAAVAVLLLAGFAVRAAISPPAAAVRAFFQALADRDAEAVHDLVAPEIADPVAADAINDQVLADGYQPPEQWTVHDTTVEDRSAVAEVSYRLDGREHEVSMRLRRDDGPADRLLPRWLVVDAIGTLTLTEAPDEVTVNGHPVAAHEPHGPAVLPALPGGYEVAVPAGESLWQERSVAATVHPQRTTEVRVPLVVRSEVRDEVEQRISALLDECAERTELVPPGCPFGYAVLAAAEDVQWRIESYPRITVEPVEQHQETVLLVQSAEDGVAVVAGVRGLGGSFETRVPFPVSGTAAPRGGSIIFDPGW
ncbi:hypothetical protein JQS43_04590 [Natronosporangium hydrolyticum]|uniref:DUF4878 domain-containing protein n=1 Tax=Natronosporangium hydrolyticum TaxID=2811111 RepID=A0A895YHU1_9ACTN|nr:hypothetical protein [Natronosporangium hydrolyticum]QSB15632.1 hypothetical protein JQS43_04590 [Natronosporangium hydrolyticum]